MNSMMCYCGAFTQKPLLQLPGNKGKGLWVIQPLFYCLLTSISLKEMTHNNNKILLIKVFSTSLSLYNYLLRNDADYQNSLTEILIICFIMVSTLFISKLPELSIAIMVRPICKFVCYSRNVWVMFEKSLYSFMNMDFFKYFAYNYFLFASVYDCTGS